MTKIHRHALFASVACFSMLGNGTGGGTGTKTTVGEKLPDYSSAENKDDPNKDAGDGKTPGQPISTDGTGTSGTNESTTSNTISESTASPDTKQVTAPVPDPASASTNAITQDVIERQDEIAKESAENMAKVESEYEMPMDEDAGDDNLDENGFAKPIAAFKHKTVRRFQVGRHMFHNHILTIFNQEDLDDFLTCWRDLTPVDKVNIVKYNWQAAAAVETPIIDSKAQRGATQTRNIPDPKRIS
jgi:hypothetical protein